MKKKKKEKKCQRGRHSTETNRQKHLKVTYEIIFHYSSSCNVPIVCALLAAPGQLNLLEIIPSDVLQKPTMLDYFLPNKIVNLYFINL